MDALTPMFETVRPGRPGRLGTASAASDTPHPTLRHLAIDAATFQPAPASGRLPLAPWLLLAALAHTTLALALSRSYDERIGFGGTELAAISVEVAVVPLDALESRAKAARDARASAAILAAEAGSAAASAAATASRATPDSPAASAGPNPVSSDAEPLTEPAVTHAKPPRAPKPPGLPKPTEAARSNTPEHPRPSPAVPPAEHSFTPGLTTASLPEPPRPAQPPAADPTAKAAEPDAAPPPATTNPPAETTAPAPAPPPQPRQDTPQTRPDVTATPAQPERAAAVATQAGGETARAAKPEVAPAAATARASPGVVRAFAKSVVEALGRSRPRRVSSSAKGTVRVAFAISTTGALDIAHVAASSGIDALDAAALAAVRRAEFPPPPAGMTQAERTYVMPYYFR